jgi:hypothetical protein
MSENQQEMPIIVGNAGLLKTVVRQRLATISENHQKRSAAKAGVAGSNRYLCSSKAVLIVAGISYILRPADGNPAGTGQRTVLPIGGAPATIGCISSTGQPLTTARRLAETSSATSADCRRVADTRWHD